VYEYPDARTSTADHLALDSGGNVVFAGRLHRNVSPTVDQYLSKWYSTGYMQFASWSDSGSADSSVAVGMDGSDNIVLAGTFEYADGDRPSIWGTNSSGGLRYIFAEVNSYQTDMVVESGGSFVTVGSDYSPYIGRIRKYNSNGSVAWTRTYAPAAYDQLKGMSVSEDSAGNIYTLFTARRASDSRLEIKTVKYSPTGVRLWVSSYTGGLGYNEGVKLVAKPTGGCVVAGYTWDGGSYTSSNGLVYSLSDAGVLEWSKSYDGPDHLDEYAVDLALAANGDVAVTGNSFTATSGPAIYTLKYTSTGTKIWLARYKSTYGTGPNALAIAPDGSVYVAGLINRTATKYSSLVLKYGAGGVATWIHKYFKIAGGNAEALDVVVDSSGNAIVGGWAETVINNSTGALLFKLH
jgi:hypothetical protein